MWNREWGNKIKKSEISKSCILSTVIRNAKDLQIFKFLRTH